MHSALRRLGIGVKAYRKQHHITQQQLADQLDISLRTVIQIEKGQSNLKFDTLYKLICELKIPADKVFYEETLPKVRKESILRTFVNTTIDEQEFLLNLCECALEQFRKARQQ